MADESFSDAVLTFIWGDHSKPSPGERPEYLTDEQIDYLPRIRVAIDLVFAEKPRYDETLEADTARREALVRAAYPELTEQAIHAIGNYYHFCYR